MDEVASKEKILPLWDHIAELAKLLKVWIYTFVLATLAFMVLPADLTFLANPLGNYRPLVSIILIGIKDRLLPASVLLIAGDFTAPIELYVLTSVTLGFAVSVPVLAYEIHAFVDPALRPEERESVYPFVTAFSLLFVVGCLFAFFILLPFVVFGTLIFLGYTGAAPYVNINDFYSLVFFTILITGVAFTLPVFIVLLVKFGIIDTKILTKRRKYVWAGTYILTAIITPDGGPLADFALFIPIILLIEGSFLIARRYEKSPKGKQPLLERSILRCTFCGGPIDSGGVFCGRCGKSRI